MALTERTGINYDDLAGRWWDVLELPHVIVTRWLHFRAMSTYGPNYAGIYELQILQGEPKHS